MNAGRRKGGQTKRQQLICSRNANARAR